MSEVSMWDAMGNLVFVPEGEESEWADKGYSTEKTPRVLNQNRMEPTPQELDAHDSGIEERHKALKTLATHGINHPGAAPGLSL